MWRWSACLVGNGGTPRADRRQCDTDADVIKSYRGRGKLSGDSTAESVSEQTNIASPVVCMSVDIGLMHQQRRLANDQQRCKYPVIQSPTQHAETRPFSRHPPRQAW